MNCGGVIIANCSNCEFFYIFDNVLFLGKCKRHAPHIQENPNDLVTTKFPVTKGDDLCGDFNKKEE